MAIDTEEWRPIPSLAYYEASSFGRIRSLDRKRPFRSRWGMLTERFHHGKVLNLKHRDNGWGGIYWSFYADGGGYVQVNRAVAEAFHSAPPSPSHEAAHLDGDTSNNRSDNVAWATPVENASHKIVHGTVAIGERNGSALLSESDIPEIISRYTAGQTSADLGAAFGVTKACILAIIRGQTWRHVTADRQAARDRAQRNIFEGPRR